MSLDAKADNARKLYVNTLLIYNINYELEKKNTNSDFWNTFKKEVYKILKVNLLSS